MPTELFKHGIEYFEDCERKKQTLDLRRNLLALPPISSMIVKALDFADQNDSDFYRASTATVVLSSQRRLLHSSAAPQILMSGEYASRISHSEDGFSMKRHSTIAFLITQSSCSQFTQQLNLTNEILKEEDRTAENSINTQSAKEIHDLIKYLVNNTKYFCKSLKSFISGVASAKTVELLVRNVPTLVHLDLCGVQKGHLSSTLKQKFYHRSMSQTDFKARVCAYSDYGDDLIPTDESGLPKQIVAPLRYIDISSLFVSRCNSCCSICGVAEALTRRYGNTLEVIISRNSGEFGLGGARERFADKTDQEYCEYIADLRKQMQDESKLYNDTDNDDDNAYHYKVVPFKTKPVHFPRLVHLDLFGMYRDYSDYNFSGEYVGIGRLPRLDYFQLSLCEEFNVYLFEGGLLKLEERPQGGLTHFVSKHGEMANDELFEELVQMKNLTYLDLAWDTCGFQEGSIQRLAESPVAPRLKVLDLSDGSCESSTEPEEMTLLCGALINIETLNLSGQTKALTNAALKALRPALHGETGSLRNLMIAYASACTMDGIKDLFRGISSSPNKNKLEILDLRDFDSGLEECDELDEFMSTASKLKFLSFHNTPGVTIDRSIKKLLLEAKPWDLEQLILEDGCHYTWKKVVVGDDDDQEDDVKLEKLELKVCDRSTRKRENVKESDDDDDTEGDKRYSYLDEEYDEEAEEEEDEEEDEEEEEEGEEEKEKETE